MRTNRLQAATLILITLAGCGAAQPAPAAPTSAPLSQPFTLTPLAKFDTPFALAFLPDGTALVTEKAGRLKHWDGQAITDVAGVPAVTAGGQGGLLDVAVSPRFATDHLVYLTYAAAAPAGGSSLTLAIGRLDAAASGAMRLNDVHVLWRDPQGGKGGQYGAVIAFAPDGKSLFLTSGERQRFTPAQDRNQPLGKILRFTTDGAPFPGNPEAGRMGALATTVTDPPANTAAARTAKGRTFRWKLNPTPAQTWSTGHRNPYGLAFDADGRLWETEMGPKGGDELNLILPGRNYGWPMASNGSNYDGSDIPDHRPGDGFEAPKLSWNPSISPGGLMIYRGAKWPQWRGDAFIATLSGESLIRVHLSGDRATKADQWPLARIRAVAQSPAGDIYLLEDEGRLVRLDRP